MKTKLYARHGDVFIHKVRKRKATLLKKQKEIVLALGEITGHSHKLTSDDDILLLDNDFNFFEIKSNGILTHEEHGNIILPPGQYVSMIQTEYDPILYRRKIID